MSAAPRLAECADVCPRETAPSSEDRARIDAARLEMRLADLRRWGALLADECAVCITHLDGLVFAHSAFRHSMNYRSVVIHGRFVAVDAEKDKKMAMIAFLEHVSPGRMAQVRPPNAAELAGTRILRLPLAEVAAKIRNWGPDDKAEDMAMPVWAGASSRSNRVAFSVWSTQAG